MIVTNNFKRCAAAAAAVVAASGGLALADSGTASAAAQTAHTFIVCDGLSRQVDIWTNKGQPLTSAKPGFCGGGTFTGYPESTQVQVWVNGANPGQLVGSIALGDMGTALRVEAVNGPNGPFLQPEPF